MPSQSPHRPAKTPSASQVELTELVLPNDTNQLGNLLGGRLMHWVDIAAALSAQRHSQRISVTASVDEMSFLLPVKLGQVVRLRASVNRAFRTSMEVGVHVDVEDFRTGDVHHVSTAFLTFVAIDEFGRAVKVPEIMPETENDKRRYADAEARRKHRLEKRDERARLEKIRDQSA
jgi:acyl-CoA hydrolase